MSQQITAPHAETSLDVILAQISRTFNVAFEPLEADGQTLEILSITNMRERLDHLIATNAIRDPLKDLPLWAKVWPASFVLGRFLRKFEPEGKTMLELGAGCGVCSLLAARHGFKKIYATDVNRDALKFAEANILRNDLSDVIEARFLDVAVGGRDERFAPGVDVIVASELLYLDDLHRPLLKFVDRHLKPGGQAFFCSDLARAKPRFQKLAAEKFSTREGKIGVKISGENGAERRVFSVLILEK